MSWIRRFFRRVTKAEIVLALVFLLLALACLPAVIRFPGLRELGIYEVQSAPLR